jgi:hypothetical protein
MRDHKPTFEFSLLEEMKEKPLSATWYDDARVSAFAVSINLTETEKEY